MRVCVRQACSPYTRRKRRGRSIPLARIEQARALGLPLRMPDGSHVLEPGSAQFVVERTPPLVTIDFLMCDLRVENGPIRQIPGTQGRAHLPPGQVDEPAWMRLSTLVGAPAGAGVIRDNRAWHGATPNVSREVRAMPNVEYGAPWTLGQGYANARSMPHAVWETLSEHGRHIARHVKADPGVWPAGAGVMHPIAGVRKRAQEGAG